MERSLTFPGVVSVAVAGEEGEQDEEVLQARDQEVSFEALSMRPTEVSVWSFSSLVSGDGKTEFITGGYFFGFTRWEPLCLLGGNPCCA